MQEKRDKPSKIPRSKQSYQCATTNEENDNKEYRPKIQQ
jgi:hypothetical protein